MRGLLLAAALLAPAGAGASGESDAGREVAGLLDRAEDLLYADGAGLARGVAEAALERARVAGDPGLEALACARLAAAVDEMGDGAPAFELLDQAEALALQSEDSGVAARVAAERSLLLWKRARYAEAVEEGERALVLGERSGDARAQAGALRALGRIAVKRGDYGRALSSLARALALAELAGDRRGRALAHEETAFAHLDQRRYATALDHYEQALALFERGGEVAAQARILKSMAALYLFQGSGEDALAAADRALALAEGAGGDAASAASAHYLRGQSLRALDRPAEARAELESALAARRGQGDPRGEAWLLARLGQLEAELERPAEALARYEAALEIWRRLEDWRAAAWFVLEAARAHDRLGDAASAREHYRAAIELAERIELPYRSIALGGLARLEARAGERAAALLDGQRAVDAARATTNLEMLWGAFADLAEVQLAFGLRREALDSLRAALAAIEALRAEAIPTDRAKRGERAERQAVYARAVGLLVDLGLAAEALEVAERARARAFLDLLASAAAGGVRAGPAPAPGADVASPAHVEVPPAALLIGEVRRRGATAVEYFVGDDRLTSWVIRPDGELRVHTTRLERAELERRVASFRGALLEGSPAALRAELRELDRLLVAPIAGWLPRDPDQPVMLVPHGALFRVSFAALLDGAGRYLVERHALHYAPALSLLAWTGRPAAASGGPGALALVVGDPATPDARAGEIPLPRLPGAEAEARAVVEALGRRHAVLLTGARATESQVRRLAAEAPLVHLATHGVLRDDDSARSLIALAPDPGGAGGGRQDGRWTLAEIQSGRLRADLVTVSACDSGLGRVSGDGVFGLSRAFLAAGARSVVVSLWRVADEVTRFQMERLYGALARPGADRSAALRAAQLATVAALRAGELHAPSGRPIPESPAYWAPFVLLGEAR